MVTQIDNQIYCLQQKIAALVVRDNELLALISEGGGDLESIQDQIDANQAQLNLLETTVQSLQDEVADLDTRLDAVESGSFNLQLQAGEVRQSWRVAMERGANEIQVEREDNFEETQGASGTYSTWTATSLNVSAGRLRDSGGSVDRAISFPSGSRLRYRSKVTLSAPDGFDTVYIGVAGASTANPLALGFYHDGAGGWRLYYFNGVGPTDIDAAVIPTGDYYFSVHADDNEVSLTVTNAARTYEEQVRFGRSAMPTISNLCLYVRDANNVSSFSLTGFKISTSALKDRTTELTDFVLAPQVGGQPARIVIPKNYDPRKPVPLLMSQHGSGADEKYLFDPNIYSGTSLRDWYQAMSNAGFIVAGSRQHGENWGNDASVDDVLNLIEWIKDNYAINAVFLSGYSMGGLSSLSAARAAAARRISIQGVLLFEPVISLLSAYNTFGAAIRAAYGIAGDGSDYASKTAGSDPMLAPVEEYGTTPYLMIASSGDNTVPPASHATPFLAKLAGQNIETSYIAVTGDHGDPSHWSGTIAASLAFFARCGIS